MPDGHHHRLVAEPQDLRLAGDIAGLAGDPHPGPGAGLRPGGAVRDGVLVPVAGRDRAALPGQLAAHARVVHDILHDQMSSPALLAWLFGERYGFGSPWRVTRKCLPGGISRPGRGLTRRCYRAGWGAVSGDQAQLPGPRGGLGAVGGAELAQQVGHVFFDRVQRHKKFAGNALV